MNSQTKSKQSSRWGSLLQGAVANLESRLDTILAEEGASKKTAEEPRPITPERVPSTTPAVGRDSKDLWARSRNRTGNRTSVESTATAGGVSSDGEPTKHSEASSSMVEEFDSLQDTQDTPSAVEEPVLSEDAVPRITVEPAEEGQTSKTPQDGLNSRLSSEVLEQESRLSIESDQREIERDVDNGAAEGSPPPLNSSVVEAPLSIEEYQAQISQMRTDYETAELQRQEDIHTYLERIDALQGKLQYLSKEVAEGARAFASEGEDHGLEKKLAAKTEQIALLMEEGQKLSKIEVTQSTTIRKLRAKALEGSHSIVDARRRLAVAEKIASETSERVVRLESNFRDASVKASKLIRVERELDELKRAQVVKEGLIQTLRQQLESANSRADAEHRQATTEALEAERKTTQSLREDIANLRIEKQLGDERTKAQSRTANEEVQREKERSSALEAGLRNEIVILEGRLEVLRARTEEVSSGVTNDGQAKLMRQVETLQTQYAQATENWQGIESALQTRLSTLEVQKDDAAKQESDARRKLRETSNNSRKIQEQLDETSRRCNVMEHELAERQANADKLQSRATDFEKRLREAKEGFETEKRAWEAKLNARIEEEKTKWRLELPPGFASPPTQVDSPTFYHRKTPVLDLPIHPRRGLSRNASVELSHVPNFDRSGSLSLSRRSSAKPGMNRHSDPQTPNGTDFHSGRSTPFPLPSIPDNIPESPSIHTMDQDDPFETGSSAQQTINDVVSGSTAGPGPSVQLVERMSAAVRRLESEKAASRDELTRLSAQRDEARKEIVNLMKEVEAKRVVDAKVGELEGKVAELNARYQTTLEMLGEKSEMVEELQADVVDLKKIYKELVMSMK